MKKSTVTTARARTLRKRPTEAEKRLWWALRTGLPGVHFRRQVPLGPYFADFCCHAAKLVIEVDGGQHGEDVDAARTAFIEREGYRVLRFWNTQVLLETAGVLESIRSALIGSHPRLTSPIKGEESVTTIQERRSLPFDGEGQGGVTALGERR